MCPSVRKKIDVSYTLYNYYKNVIESYVADYYVKNHWKKMPKSWQSCLENISLDHIADLLDLKKPVRIVLSLSLLCVRNIIINNVISRDMIADKYYLHKNIDFCKSFWRKIKLKKRHEIEKFSKISYNNAVETNCCYIVDIGSGLGHLSRMLSYGYGLKVCTFEANSVLSNLAKELDHKFEMELKSKGHDGIVSQTIHVNKRIEYDIDSNTFLNMVKKAFNNHSESFKFGLVGLHPCGDLGSTLLQLYNNCPNIAFINMASCCYMKLTLEPESTSFPLSSFCRNNNISLNYLACEIACHAIENYVKRIRTEKHVSKLKIHAYRAGLEQVLVSIDPNLKHSAVCNVKYDESLSFKKYCDKSFNKLFVVPSSELVAFYNQLIEQTWKDVVTFYSIRLLFAPLIETIILFDRLLYTEDGNSDCEIVPLFDCNISPRNQVLSAKKRNIV